MSDDITFCGSDCKNKKCFRHPSNIQEPRIPHSFAYMKDTEDCPMKKQDVRPIDANALKEAMMKAFDCKNATKYGNKNAEQQAHSYSTLMLYEISNIVEVIDNAPTVAPTLRDDIIEAFNKITDQEFEYSNSFWIVTPKGKKIEFEKKRPHGEWIEHKGFGTNGHYECEYSCSKCNEWVGSRKTNFCPNCGADLRGTKE